MTRARAEKRHISDLENASSLTTLFAPMKKKRIQCSPLKAENSMLKPLLGKCTSPRKTPEHNSAKSQLDGSPKKIQISQYKEEIVGDQLSSHSPSIVGREAESDRIYQFLENSIHQRKGNILYICGAPGTGKSYTVSKSVEALRKNSGVPRFDDIYINAMALRSSTDVYKQILCGSSLKKIHADQIHDAEGEVRKLFFKKDGFKRTMTVLVLDELDGLLRSQANLPIVYSLFEMASRQFSSLILVGIANAVDLTESVLPRLFSSGLKHDIMVFQTYTKSQILSILSSNLISEASNLRPMDEAALQLCSTKISSGSGDLRKALELCKEANRVALSDGSAKISFKHMAMASNALHGSKHIKLVQGLPQHQQILLSVIYVLFRQVGHSSLSELHNFYMSKARKLSLPEAASSEFADLVSFLCSNGILSQQSGGGRKKQSKILLRIPLSDLEIALESTSFFRLITEGN